MKIKQKIKKYFTEKPKQDFWFWAFITMFLFRYVAPTMIMFLMFFQIGLVAPEADMTSSIERASTNVTNAFMKPMEILFNTGATIGTNNPIIAKVLFYTFGYFVYVIWFAAILLLINLLRYGTSWIVRKKCQKN